MLETSLVHVQLKRIAGETTCRLELVGSRREATFALGWAELNKSSWVKVDLSEIRSACNIVFFSLSVDSTRILVVVASTYKDTERRVKREGDHNSKGFEDADREGVTKALLATTENGGPSGGRRYDVGQTKEKLGDCRRKGIPPNEEEVENDMESK
ncbi:hypothetical protein CRG98_040271 [Punica granatum]|uniref:Uncharacterized protein n=1 Tax=Punica granatum TaxID=22663 RepID=A0A2I0I7E4_PUNGR|nr:hypothetical protein CRG98_040271 [Punica granatum]